jgi:hypothetical protein
MMMKVEDVTSNNADESFVSSAATPRTESNNLKSNSTLNEDNYDNTSLNSSSLTNSSFSLLNDSNPDNTHHGKSNKKSSGNLTKCKICFNKYADLSRADETSGKSSSHQRIYQLNSCKCKFCIDVSVFLLYSINISVSTLSKSV